MRNQNGFATFVIMARTWMRLAGVLGALLCLLLGSVGPARAADGDLDTSFDPGTGANGSVQAVALQSDGKVLIGGFFTTVNNTTRNRIARLNSDGTLDTSFDPGTGADDAVLAVALQSDGKVLIGGFFTSVNNTTRNRVARLLGSSPPTPPTVLSVVRAGTSPTSSSSVSFTVTFSEAVTGVDSTDFLVTRTGGVSGGVVPVSGVSGSGASYTVTVSNYGFAGAGTLGVEVLDDDSIKDNENTPTSAGFSSGETYTIQAASGGESFYIGTDGSAEVLKVTAPYSPAAPNAAAPAYASGAPLDASVGIARASDNTLYVTGAFDNEIIKISPDGSTKTVLSPPAGATTNLLNTPIDLVLAAGNPSTLYVTSRGNSSIVAVNTNTGAQTPISQDGFLVAPTGLIQGPDGKLYTANLDDNNVVRIDIATGAQEVYASITDAPQLWGVAFGFDGALYVSTPNNSPDSSLSDSRVVRVAPPATAGGVGGAQTEVPSGGLLINLTGMAYSRSDNSLYVATYDNADPPNGRIVRLPLDGTTAPQTITRTTTTAPPIEVEMLAPFTFTPPTPPSVVSVLRNGNNPTSSTSVTFTVLFSEAVTGVDATDFALIRGGGITGGTVSAVSGTGTTYSVTVSGFSGTGTVGLQVLDDDTIKDNEGTPLSAGNSSGEVFTIQNSATLASGTPGQILFSEVRFSGPGGTTDDYIELYNTTTDTLDISGFRILATSTGGQSFPLTLPANAILVPRGHFLIAGPGYSLGTSAMPDLVLAAGTDLQQATLELQNRSNAEVDRVALSLAGSGLSGSEQHAFARRFNPTTTSEAINTGAASDFFLVATSVTNGNLSTVQGAPGPEGTQSPVQRNATLAVANFDTSVSATAFPNRSRDNTAGAAGGPVAFGTLTARFKVTNNTGQRVTQLSLRAVRLTTKNSPGYTATNAQGDLRILSSSTATVNGQTVYGTTLQAPAQAEGGGLNSSVTLPLASGTMTLSDPLEPGETQSFSFLFGVAKKGTINFTLNLEATPAP